MKKTDEKILEACSRVYRFMGAKEIAGLAGLKYVTVNQRVAHIEKAGLLVSESYGKGKRYRFNFDFDPARKLRLFSDSLFLYSTETIKSRLETLLAKSRKNDNIVSIIVYGSCLDTDEFNDVDILVVSKEAFNIDGFDVFNLNPDSFRKLLSLGELRLQAALLNGRIFLDREFIFSYLNNDLPVVPSDEIVSAMNKKIVDEVRLLDEEKDFNEAKKRLIRILETKGQLAFSKNRQAIPSRPNFTAGLKQLDHDLYEKIRQVQLIKTKNNFWEYYYQMKESL